MEASTSSESKTQQVLHEADTYVRENPVPAVLCALGIGFFLGLLIRGLNRPTRREMLEERADELKHYLSSLMEPITKESTKAYRRSARAMRGAVESAKDIDVEDYTEPVMHWFGRIWRKVRH